MEAITTRFLHLLGRCWSFCCTADDASFLHGAPKERPSSGVILDTGFKGNLVKLSQDKTQVMGFGTICANAPLLQDRVYFEVKLVEPGFVGIGVCTHRAEFDKKLGSDEFGWGFWNTGHIVHENNATKVYDGVFSTDDVLGVSVSGGTLRVWHNGRALGEPVFTDQREKLFAAVSVGEDSVISVNFGDDGFEFLPDPSLQPICLEVDLIAHNDDDYVVDMD